MASLFSQFRHLWGTAQVTGSYARAYSTPITAGSFTTPQLSLPIPSRGKYLVHAKVVVSNTSPVTGTARVDCKLALGGGGGDLDFSGATLDPAAGTLATIALHTAWEFASASSVDLYCLTFFNTPAEAANIKMSAIRVDDLQHGNLP
jgi:hypothetical protein